MVGFFVFGVFASFLGEVDLQGVIFYLFMLEMMIRGLLLLFVERVKRKSKLMGSMPKGSKRKGSGAERELVRMFWETGWAAMRAAGSGSQQYPSPDLLVGKAGRRLAIEAKLTSDTRKYLSREELRHLDYFGKMFGAEVWVAVKFPNIPWAFFQPEDLIETTKHFAASVDLAKQKGLLFEELTEQ